MLLGYYGDQKTVEELSVNIPQLENEKGEKMGTINQQMATWCLSQGYDVSLYTFDCQVIDQAWANLPQETMLERLELRKTGWTVPSLGNDWTKAYAQSYIDYVNAGGELNIQPAVTSQLLYKLLETGPVLPCLSFSTLYGEGRSRIDGEENEKSIHDDIKGRALNHSVVIYGNDKEGSFLVADPWQKPGLHVVEPERMLAAISTAQIECDNLLFQISKPENKQN